MLGTVTGGDGKPVARAAGAGRRLGAADEFTTFSKADGTYALRDLPVEPVTVRFERDKVGKASFAVRGNPGETIRFDAILSLGLRLVGRVVDETGAGVKGANVQASPMESAKVDANDSGASRWPTARGASRSPVASDVPHRMWITNGLTGDSKRLENVMPGRGELVITVPAMPKADCSILGTVVDSQRKPVASAQVSPYRMGASFSPIELSDASGAFKVGNLTPGTYAVEVSGAGLASRRLPRHELKPGDSWDLGVIELPPGARLTVHYRLGPEVDPAAKPWFDLIDEAGPTAAAASSR